MEKKMEKICRLKAAVERAERKLREAHEKLFPEGRTVYFCKGRGHIEATILDHGRNDVRIVNLKTKKIYRVEFYDLMNCGTCKKKTCYGKAN